MPGVDIDYRFMVAGIEAPGAHSCPRVFLRAGVDPDFAGSHLDIEVPYAREEPIAPGLREGTLAVHEGGEVWMEAIQVDVRRADGLFDRSLPVDEWRVSLTVSHHDATTDLEIDADDVPYCNIFPICI
ncbi:MAG: hypothetical protein EVA89_10695 [Sandaracinaceae bacterium]|nr:MAG: hypothetical protein EVA89_10695 [Sandaracinaceae bacterium]